MASINQPLSKRELKLQEKFQRKLSSATLHKELERKRKLEAAFASGSVPVNGDHWTSTTFTQAANDSHIYYKHTTNYPRVNHYIDPQNDPQQDEAIRAMGGESDDTDFSE